MEKATEDVLTRLRAEIKSGHLTRPPSSRSLASTTGLHRHTCIKILSQLRSEGLIKTHRGTSSTIVKAENDPVAKAVDYLLNQGMTGAEAQKELLKALKRREAITIHGPNQDLIKFELDGFGFTFRSDGLTVSDHPGSEFLLQLSDVKDVSKQLKGQRCVGIISKSKAFRTHISGSLAQSGEIVEAEPIPRLVTSVFHFCKYVVCDYLIATKLKQFAIEYKRETGKGITVIPAPYLNPKTIDELRGKLINV